MAGEFRTVYEGKEGEITEKKSRFIATVRLVETEEEALQILAAVRKKYWDARHNCFAYIIGNKQEIVRCSDDGEPSGTAGRPMLDVLLGEGLCNVIVVVTRYFGGVLLGTGGLVRAYSKAVQEGLAKSRLMDVIPGIRMTIQTDYNGIGKLQYFFSTEEIPVLQTDYTDKVTATVLLSKERVAKVKAQITEATNGKAVMEETEELYFAVVDREIVCGEALTQYKTLEV